MAVEIEKKDADKTKRRTGKTYWHLEATNVIKSLMTREGVSYKSLSNRLEQRLGIVEDARTLGNKINRGTFSFIFFIQCLHALGHTESKFQLAPLPAKRSQGTTQGAKK
jgi:hypothetical protein